MHTSPSKALAPYPDLICSLIAKGRRTSVLYLGREPAYICLPYTTEQQTWLKQFNDSWAIALTHFPGKLTTHYPADKLIQFAKMHPFLFPKCTALTPLPSAVNVFTDGSSNGIAAYKIDDEIISWNTSQSSAQVVELLAVQAALLAVRNLPCNLFSDGQYIVHALQILETVPFIGTVNTYVNQLFFDIQQLLRSRQHPCYFGHLRAHTNLPGPLASGNAQVDDATQIYSLTAYQLAQQSHALHHQNSHSHSLRLQFKIPREAARQIVKSCLRCPQFTSVPHYGVNPRGLLPNHLWQMDVTHIKEFRNTPYVHVTIDTFSGFLHATLQTGEASKHCIAHVLKCLAIMGQPKIIKTDNGPGYTGKMFQTFCARLQICHKTGIPYNPQGQGIVERSHQTLKHQLLKIKKGELYPSSPQNQLNHALFVLNFLTLDIQGKSAAQ